MDLCATWGSPSSLLSLSLSTRCGRPLLLLLVFSAPALESFLAARDPVLFFLPRVKGCFFRCFLCSSLWRIFISFSKLLVVLVFTSNQSWRVRRQQVGTDGGNNIPRLSEFVIKVPLWDKGLLKCEIWKSKQLRQVSVLLSSS